MTYEEYLNTLNKIKASERFKDSLKSGLSIHMRNGKDKKNYITQLVFVSIVVIAIGAGMVLGQIINLPNQSKAISSNMLTPHIEYQNNMYWLCPYTEAIQLSLPSGYQFAGKILSAASENSINLNNMQSSFSHIGDKIYIDPVNNQSLFLYTDLFSQKGTNRYLLFVKKLSKLIFYNGRTFTYSDMLFVKSNEYPWPSNCSYRKVGSINLIDYTNVPSHNFEVNFTINIGSPIYASLQKAQILYIEQEQISNPTTTCYLEFKS